MNLCTAYLIIIYSHNYSKGILYSLIKTWFYWFPIGMNSFNRYSATQKKGSIWLYLCDIFFHFLILRVYMNYSGTKINQNQFFGAFLRTLMYNYLLLSYVYVRRLGSTVQKCKYSALDTINKLSKSNLKHLSQSELIFTNHLINRAGSDAPPEYFKCI